MSKKHFQAWSLIRYPVICGCLAILLLFTLISFMQSYSAVQAQSPLLGKEKIGSGALEALETENEIRVVIALVAPSIINTQSFDLNRTKNEIAATQDFVLSSVSPSDFIVKHQYQAVPALAGLLLTESGLNQLVANPFVTKIDLDVGGSGSLATSVPLIGADTWHNAGNTGNGVVVAVLDSGLDSDHSDLAPALIHQECFLDDDTVIDGNGLCPNGSDRQSGPGAAEDDVGHGTHVTGIIASRGQQSAVGVAPGSQIVAIKVTAGPSFSGTFYYFSEIVAALDFIINNRPDVQIINMSLLTNDQFSGNCDNTTSWNMAGANAINILRSQGVVSFASSGNSGSGTLMASPACLSNVISVGATDNNDTIASFTDSNSATDIVAPGVDIRSSGLGNSTKVATGTSMASAHAAGCAALLIAGQEATTPNQIESRLESSPVQVLNPKNGLTFPRLDCSLKPLENVVISGPILGINGANYSFTAAVDPLMATQPISYHWQATGQLPITNLGGTTDTVSFAWAPSGTKVISVTAQNMAGSVTNVHTITVDSPQFPLLDVAISGSSTGFTDDEYSFIASVNPLTATQPISYFWQATDQAPLTNSAGLSNTVSFLWSNGGTKVISLTAQNTSSSITAVHTITLEVPLLDVDLSGPTSGLTDENYAFIATSNPLTATQPITYFWQATDQTSITNTTGLSDTVSFVWHSLGTKVISVNVENIDFTTISNYTIQIKSRVYLPVSLK